MYGRILACLIGLTAFVSAGSAPQAGTYAPPPWDSQPTISHDSTAVVFFRSTNRYTQLQPQPGLHVMNPDGSHERVLAGLPANPSFALSRTWHWIAFAGLSGGKAAIVVMRPDASEQRTVTMADARDTYIANVSWAPNEQQLAFERRDGVWTVRIDGTGLTHIAGGGLPTWAPDGKHIAFIAGSHVVVAAPDGSGAQTISDTAAWQPIAWAPDGSRLAYIHSNRAITIARADGGAFTHYAAHTRPFALAWSPDSRRLAYAADGRPVNGKTIVDQGVYRITPGKTTVAAQTRLPLEPTKWPGARQDPPRGGLAWAPSGNWLMVSVAGSCRDRLGIYRLDARARTAAKRLTNDCHIVGTKRGEYIEGTSLYDIVLGLGGDDELAALDENYQGDDLYGGAGNDRLTGDLLPNVLDGGPGDDKIFGREQPDTITGGPGHDQLYGEENADLIYAADGTRDLVDCGTNSARQRKDTAYIDRFDVVRHCQRVVRR